MLSASESSTPAGTLSELVLKITSTYFLRDTRLSPATRLLDSRERCLTTEADLHLVGDL